MGILQQVVWIFELTSLVLGTVAMPLVPTSASGRCKPVLAYVL